MNVMVLCLALCGALIMLEQPALAGDHQNTSSLSPDIAWDAGGSLRLRYEWKQGFALGKPGAVDPQDYLLSQLRIHLNIHQSDDWALFLEGQDARVHHAFLRNTINDTKPANIFADHFDLHQAFIRMDWGDDFGSALKVGRQKFNLGTQRMVASLEWVNTARVWDAIRFTQRLGGKGRKVDLFASHLVAVRPQAFNTHAPTGNRMFDSQFYGVYLIDQLSIQDSRFELYYLLRRNTRAGDRVQTYGIRYDYKQNGLNADAEGMLQTGNYGFLRQLAYAAHIGIGHVVGEGLHLGVAYNYGSGDSNPLDGKHQTFDNLYPLNHAYYGFMDFFSLQNIHNAEGVLKWKLNQTNQLRLAYQGFWLANATTDAWYNAGGGVVRQAGATVSSYVGSEIDLTLVSNFKPWHLSTVLGYSHFFTGSYIQQTGNSRDANFFFLQSKYVY